MSVLSVYRFPESLPEDLEQLRQMSEKFVAGEIPAARFQAFRVPQGVYEQRESGTYMLRARLAAGILTPAQMRVAAEVALTYGNGALHFTSRQDLQVHGVKAEGIYAAVARLAEGGLSTKGGGGNTVRNIAACYQTGVCPDELFDVTPVVIQLTEALLPDPLSFQLPRKYKIACSGCGKDCAGATVNDLGFIAKRHGGVDGYSVWVGGGMGAQSRTGQLLEEFILATQAPRLAEAIKRVFDKHGNRKNRSRARIRFLIDDLGLPRFRDLYLQELSQLSGQYATPGDQSPAPLTPAAAALATERPDFGRWRVFNTAEQKQPGLFTVEIAPPLGVLDAVELNRLAAIVERFGEFRLRATNWQTVLLRGVREAELPALHDELNGLALGAAEPPLLRHLTACAGASTCRLGIGLARGAATAIRQALLASDLNLEGPVGQLSLQISGCPNSCGRHLLAQIGLSGAARRVDGRLVPYYIVHLGGHVEEGKTVLASGSLAVPARRIPAFLVDFLRTFDAYSQTDFDAFLAAGGRRAAADLSAQYAQAPAFEQDPDFYSDWGAAQAFSLAGRGPAECGAGVFDLINLDLASAHEALEDGRLFAATTLAARALLVTRGEQADSDARALERFQTLFIDQELVPETLRPVIEQGRQASSQHAPEQAFQAGRDEVAVLVNAVRQLYQDMGPSLRIPEKTQRGAAL